MADVAWQSGHEGGEAGPGGARVSAAAAAVEGGDADGRPTCCVCMEPWTDSGPHRICCIPCGHVYGRSCLENWLSRGRSKSAKCPQCGKRFTHEHIINLYAPGNLWDRYTCTRCHIQASVTSGRSGSKSDLCKQVLDIFNEPANIVKEHGVHVDEIVKQLKLPESNIWDAIMEHVNMGNIYCTIDEFHFKSAVNELPYYLTFQAPVTSGPSRSESVLWKVLDILLANIEKEHGLHLEEISRRLSLPKGDILEAMEYHVDCGHVYTTIDDFHFKAVPF